MERRERERPEEHATEPAQKQLTVEEREEVLNEQIAFWEAKGYHVEHRTTGRATMVKPKKFSFWWAFLWFLTLVMFLPYLIYYAAKKDKRISISVDPYGNIVTREIK